jgi:hypothetical protein
LTTNWSRGMASAGESPSADELSALSRRHGNATVLLLPVNGKIAVFSRDYQLQAIVDEAPTISQLEAWSREFEIELHAHTVHVNRLREMGVQESNDRELAKNLRQARIAKPVVHFDTVTIDDLE